MPDLRKQMDLTINGARPTAIAWTFEGTRMITLWTEYALTYPDGTKVPAGAFEFHEESGRWLVTVTTTGDPPAFEGYLDAADPDRRSWGW